jgi:hypothetical protein
VLEDAVLVQLVNMLPRAHLIATIVTLELTVPVVLSHVLIVLLVSILQSLELLYVPLVLLVNTLT